MGSILGFSYRIKKCAAKLALFLTGIFLTSWKAARVQPVPKNGPKTIPSNYRPISLLPIICKAMERCSNSKLLKYLECHKLIHDRQYGFRHGRPTADLLTFLTHHWNKSIEFHGEAQIVALDISKAFDQVWHDALLRKLPAYGLSPTLCAWTASFLSNRSICVVVDGHSSSAHKSRGRC